MTPSRKRVEEAFVAWGDEMREKWSPWYPDEEDGFAAGAEWAAREAVRFVRSRVSADMSDFGDGDTTNEFVRKLAEHFGIEEEK